MEEKDLQQIGQLIDERVGKLIDERVPKIIDEMVSPRFSEMREDFAGMIEENINPQFDEINGRLGRMEAVMVTKDYLDNKLANIKGDSISKLRKVEARDDCLIDILKNKKVLDKKNVGCLDEFRIFPVIKI